jgi:arabinogalactan oligomer/maltooligosaccharide transport system permease protein
MFLAMIINSKGIGLKKFWRTVFVITMAIPAFISLRIVSTMLGERGIFNVLLQQWGFFDHALPFLTNATWARISVIAVNFWIGVPVTMLMVSGILMNIPSELYESAKLDGAGPVVMFRKITFPYMWFVTTPYLISNLVSNVNNFNVIYLLTGGAPTNPAASSAAGSVGYTDLLITWLFKITTGAESQYYMASVVGILVFVVVALISLVVYNVLPSIKNEEDFQ